jgi:hypothetical protein
LFSDQAQFRFGFDGYPGPKTVNARFSTAFNCSRRVKPMPIGGSVYFVDDMTSSVYSRLMEYYPRDNQVGDDADDVSSPVPEYIAAPTKWAAATSTTKCAFISDGSNTLWTHRWYWAGDKKIQNAWGKWTFSDCSSILWGDIAQDNLYLIVVRPDGVWLETVSLKEDVFTTSTDFSPLLDRLVSIPSSSMSYNTTTGKTTITLPYNTTSSVEIISSEPGTGPTVLKNTRQIVTKVSGNTVTVAGNITTHSVVAGIPYDMYYQFSTPYVREDKGNGQVVVLDGRLQVRYLSVEYHNTYYFKSEVSAQGRDTSVMEFSGQTLGVDSSTLGGLNFATGVFQIPIMAENKATKVVLRNDSPYPCYFGGAEVMAHFYPKAYRRV